MKRALVILMTVVLLTVSCSYEETVNDHFYPYCRLEEFESFFAQVTFLSSDMSYPELYTENGKEYLVAVINGFDREEYALEIKGELTVRDGIMAINSSSFYKADNVTSVVLPSSCRSLGKNSLPQKASEMTMTLKAATDLWKAVSDENKGNLHKLTVTGGGELLTISGNFCNLESVTVTNDGRAAYWPVLPTLRKTGYTFHGWEDADGNSVVSGTRINGTSGTAHPVWEEGDDPDSPSSGDEDTSQGSSTFRIPQITLQTSPEYRLSIVNNGDGTYTVTPASTSSGYTLYYDGVPCTFPFEEGKWKVTVHTIGSHTFSVFYLDGSGNAQGFAQITFEATAAK